MNPGGGSGEYGICLDKRGLSYILEEKSFAFGIKVKYSNNTQPIYHTTTPILFSLIKLLLLRRIRPHLPRLHFPHKQMINLAERLALKLRNIEERPNSSESAQAPKHEADLALEIRLVGVDHVGNNDVERDAENGLGCGCEPRGFGAQGWGGGFAEDGKGHGADGEEVDEGVEDGEGGLDPARGAGGNDVEDADEDEDGGDADHALKEDFAAAV